jgi:hypothetical protein
MAHGWASSNRRDRLPGNWPALRKHVFERAGYLCEAVDDGVRCTARATDCDHIARGDPNPGSRRRYPAGQNRNSSAGGIAWQGHNPLSITDIHRDALTLKVCPGLGLPTWERLPGEGREEAAGTEHSGWGKPPPNSDATRCRPSCPDARARPADERRPPPSHVTRGCRPLSPFIRRHRWLLERKPPRLLTRDGLRPTRIVRALGAETAVTQPFAEGAASAQPQS